MDKTLEQKYKELEKRVVVLEGRVQVQPRKFVPEDSEGVCINSTSCKCPN